MTILEAIQANPVFSDVSENTLNTVLIGRSLDGSAEYTESSLKDVELASADLYLLIAITPEFKEGQLSIKYDSTVLKDRAKNIYAKYEDAKLEELQPKPINIGITDASDYH